MTTKSKSPKDTFEFARRLAAGLTRGGCFAVSGDLGAGKTVFAKGFAKGLGIKDTITSPTFVIMNRYGGGRFPFYHFDMYRIDAKQAENLGFREIFEDNDAVCLAEWPENAAEILPKNTVYIEIRRAGETAREIITHD